MLSKLRHILTLCCSISNFQFFLPFTYPIDDFLTFSENYHVSSDCNLCLCSFAFSSLYFKISHWSHLMCCVFHLVLLMQIPTLFFKFCNFFLWGISNLFPESAFYFYFSSDSDMSFASSGKGLWYAVVVSLDTAIKV